MQPVLRHIANLWTLQKHPSSEQEWSLDEKLDAMQKARFDGVCWAPSAELSSGARERGLIFLGGMATLRQAQIPQLLRELKQHGALHVNVQLGADTTGDTEALRMTLELMREAKELELRPAIEFHRGTCTETPEKAYALADGYAQATGEMLPISWDFSHFAVVKHLTPPEFVQRLLVRPELIQYAQQFHFRPFNGHHVQVPITKSGGGVTQEVQDWKPFAEAVLRCWLEGNLHSGREVFICPELGPVEGGYALSTSPNSWEDAVVLRDIIAGLWKTVTADYGF